MRNTIKVKLIKIDLKNIDYNYIKMNWAEDFAKKLMKQVDVSIGDHHTTIYNLGDGKTVQFDYFKDECTNVEYKDEKLDKERKEMFDLLKKVN